MELELELEVEKADNRAKAVPESVMESVKSTLVSVEDLRSNFDQFLSLSHPDVVSHLPPLQRALSLLTLARATSALFAVRLRCTGVHPDAHRVKGDLERINRYQDKLERYLGSTKAPNQPSIKLNVQAANRFIQHSLPDLTAHQIRSLREIAKNEAGRINFSETNFQRKRKYHYHPPPAKLDKPTIQASVHEFLEKTVSQAFDSKQEGHKKVKEPIVPILIEDSSGEDKEELEEEDDDDDELEQVEVDDQLEEEEDNYLEDELKEVKKMEQETKYRDAPVFIILDSSDED